MHPLFGSGDVCMCGFVLFHVLFPCAAVAAGTTLESLYVIFPMVLIQLGQIIKFGSALSTGVLAGHALCVGIRHPVIKFVNYYRVFRVI